MKKKHDIKISERTVRNHINKLGLPAIKNQLKEMVDALKKLIDLFKNVKYEPLKTGKERREWLGKTDKRIVIHFTPFHGSWLNMIEIWFGILNQRCIKELRPQSVLELQNQIRHFIQSWNTYYAHPFQWNYSGDDHF